MPSHTAPRPASGAESTPIGYFTAANSADVVIARMEGCPNDRLKTIMSALVRHLHAAIKEVELTTEEWAAAIDFLTRTGQICSDWRQEFILLSDVLGASMLVDAINHDKGGGTTESTVLGPFHVENAPRRALGDSICLDGIGEPVLVRGRVTDEAGRPIPHALLDVWQANGDGFYDVQQQGLQPEMNLRGLFEADDEGRFWFRSIVPQYYAIPHDGPVGRLLIALGRHPYRPAHIHFIVAADGYEPVTTHIFMPGDPYLESDAVFGVKESLIATLRDLDDPAAAGAGEAPKRVVEWDFRLMRRRAAPAEPLS